MPEHFRFPRERHASEQSYNSRPGRSGQSLREDWRGSTGARLPSRNRSLEWQALHQPHQRPQTRPDEAQDPQAGESGRMVEIESLSKICDCEIERAPRRSMTPSPGSRLLKGGLNETPSPDSAGFPNLAGSIRRGFSKARIGQTDVRPRN